MTLDSWAVIITRSLILHLVAISGLTLAIMLSKEWKRACDTCMIQWKIHSRIHPKIQTWEANHFQVHIPQPVIRMVKSIQNLASRGRSKSASMENAEQSNVQMANAKRSIRTSQIRKHFQMEKIINKASSWSMTQMKSHKEEQILVLKCQDSKCQKCHTWTLEE